MNTAEIDTALAPLLAAAQDLAGRIGTLAVIGAARIIREEVPGAASADLAWTTEGDAAYLEPSGEFRDAGGTVISVPGRISLDTRLLQYSFRLDETNTSAWHDLVTAVYIDGKSVSRLDVNAALALPLPTGLPGLPSWIGVLETAVRETAGGYATGSEARRLAGAYGNGTIPEALGDTIFAVCDRLDPDED